METFNKKTIGKILKNKNKLEKSLQIKLEPSGRKINIAGEELKVFTAEKVLQAIGKNIPIQTSLLLKNENYLLVELPIKKFTKKSLESVKARIIGTQGKTIRTLQNISECYITLDENIVTILGPSEKIKDTETAIEKLIQGSKTSNVYAFLEKQNKKQKIKDLGLKQDYQ